MFKKITCFCGLFFAFSLYPVQAETMAEYNDEYIEENPQDMWFGPGYYYGVWFNNEEDYRTWRGDHQEYPPNHDYYSHDHPIEYSPEGSMSRGGHGGRR